MSMTRIRSTTLCTESCSCSCSYSGSNSSDADSPSNPSI